VQATLPALQGAARHHRHPRHGRLSLAEDKLAVRAGAQDPALSVAAIQRGQNFTGTPGKYVPLKDTIRASKMIVNGEWRQPARAGVLHGGRDRRKPSKKAKTLQ